MRRRLAQTGGERTHPVCLSSGTSRVKLSEARLVEGQAVPAFEVLHIFSGETVWEAASSSPLEGTHVLVTYCWKNGFLSLKAVNAATIQELTLLTPATWSTTGRPARGFHCGKQRRREQRGRLRAVTQALLPEACNAELRVKAAPTISYRDSEERRCARC